MKHLKMRSGLKMTQIYEFKTEAGKELFEYFNDNYGSSIWGPVLRGILAIEKELT